MPSYLEFFAGGGMARAGLGADWSCLLANDVDARKAAAYCENWGAAEFRLADIADLTPADIPGQADMAWASFPCQDLSLAGAQAGLRGRRSGTFYPFWSLMRGLAADGRAPRVIALENVCGALTSRGGQDFDAIGRTFAGADYRWGALVVDAALYTPQSRPRLFMIGARSDVAVPAALHEPAARAPFHSAALRAAVAGLSREAARRHLWWRLPPPPPRTLGLCDLIEDAPADAPWHSPAQTERLLSMMSPANRRKVDMAARDGARRVGTVYRRTRPAVDGGRLQRAEARFDGLAGCLRTPAGGSSRQTILVVEGAQVRSRLISARETARLMGLPDSYRLPRGYTDAYHLTGDGVVAPVVGHIARQILEPLLTRPAAPRAAA